MYGEALLPEQLGGLYELINAFVPDEAADEQEGDGFFSWFVGHGKEFSGIHAFARQQEGLAGADQFFFGEYMAIVVVEEPDFGGPGQGSPVQELCGGLQPAFAGK